MPPLADLNLSCSHVLPALLNMSVTLHVSHNVKNRTFVHVRPAKIQISLRIRAVWSESSLGAFWIARMESVFVRTTKTLIRLRGCAGWSESSLCAHVRRYVFSRCSSCVLKYSHIRCLYVCLMARNGVICPFSETNSNTVITNAYPITVIVHVQPNTISVNIAFNFTNSSSFLYNCISL